MRLGDAFAIQQTTSPDGVWETNDGHLLLLSTDGQPMFPPTRAQRLGVDGAMNMLGCLLPSKIFGFVLSASCLTGKQARRTFLEVSLGRGKARLAH